MEVEEYQLSSAPAWFMLVSKAGAGSLGRSLYIRPYNYASDRILFNFYNYIIIIGRVMSITTVNSPLSET